MGKKDSGAKEAARARADEEARQQRIRQGTERINSIFDGQTTGTGAATGAFDPTKTYYNADGSVWKPGASNPVDLRTIAPAPQTVHRINAPQWWQRMVRAMKTNY